MFTVEYDKDNRNWSLYGAGDGQVVLTFEQAVVTTDRQGHPASSPVRFRAVFGLVIPPEAEALIHPREMSELGVSPTPRLPVGGLGRTWRLTSDGRVENARLGVGGPR